MKRIYNFTLLELLIVIAVIGILVSLLLPSLWTARERAKMAVCMSNIHQLHIGTHSYLSNNNGFYPSADDWTNTTPRVRVDRGWFREIADNFHLETEEERKEFFCPSNPSGNGLRGSGGLPPSYGVNGNGTPGELGAWAPFKIKPNWKKRTLMDFNHPSDQLIYIESQGEGTTPLINHPQNADLDSDYDVRRIQRGFFYHLKKNHRANYGFIDGSSRTLRPISTASGINMWGFNMQENGPAPSSLQTKLIQAEQINHYRNPYWD